MADAFKYAVLDFLGAESSSTADRLASFHERDWGRYYRWLDEGGIALYLADRLQHMGRFRGLPPPVQARLEQNLGDSRERAHLLFEEFSRLVRAFSETGAPFVVHKGFALVPDYCSDAALRTQADIDFQIGVEHIPLFSNVLSSLGYRQTGAEDGELTFDTRPEHTPNLADIYKSRSSFCVELHFDGSEMNHIGALPDRGSIETKRLCGLLFPVLNKQEAFLHQVAHIAQHFRSGWLRLSMLYELRHFLRKNADDLEFWSAIRRCCECDQISSNVAYALALVACSFGESERTKGKNPVDGLPPHAHLWMKNWGRKYLVAPFPGSKLQLLLGSRCPGAHHSSPVGCRPEFRRFVPWHSAMHRITAVMRAVAEHRVPSDELAFVRFLLMHHVRTNVGYAIQRITWRRALRRAQLSS